MGLNSKDNVVTRIANQAGISLASTGGFNNNAGSIMTHASEAASNAVKIGDIAQQIAEQQAPGASSPQSGGNGFIRSALTTGALTIGMIVAPQVTAVAAAVVSVGEAAHFGLKGNAGQGEMTIAHSDAAEAFDNGVYVSAFDGTSTDIMTGKTVAKSAPMGQAAAAPAKGMHNIKDIIAEQTAGMDMDDIRADVETQFKAQAKAFGQDMRRLREMGAININDPNALTAEQKMGELGDNIRLALSTPKKALNVGMGAPTMGM